MSIQDTFEQVTPREFAGQDTFRSYRYQVFFAANLLLKMLEKSDKDGMLLLDYFDDVVFLDNENTPTLINFYQVKSNKECRITVSSMIRNEFLQKMAWNLEQFRENECCATFVTNGEISVNFNNANKPLHIKGYPDFSFSETSPVSVTSLIESKEMAEEAIGVFKKYLPDGVDLNQIHFLKTDFSLDNFEIDFLGKITNYFANKNTPMNAVEIRAITDSLISRMEEKQGPSFRKTNPSFGDIKANKGIKIAEFERIVDSISAISIPQSFDDLYSFSKEELLYDFEGKNIAELALLYSEFKNDYVQSNAVMSEINAFLKTIGVTGVKKEELFLRLDDLLRQSVYNTQYAICEKYHSIIVCVYLYKIVKGVKL